MKGKSESWQSAHPPKVLPGHIRKLALIGAGKLGEGLLTGILGSQFIPVSHVEVTVEHQRDADSLRERFLVSLTALTAGEHLVTVRVYDASGNAGLARRVIH